MNKWSYLWAVLILYKIKGTSTMTTPDDTRDQTSTSDSTTPSFFDEFSIDTSDPTSTSGSTTPAFLTDSDSSTSPTSTGAKTSVAPDNTNSTSPYCNVSLTAELTSQTFTSPNYPANYDNNMYCFLSISTASADYSIELKPAAIDMEYTTYCTADYVAIYDGNNSSSSLLGQYCGSTIPGEISSSSQFMYVLLVSDESFNYNGVSIEYAAVDNSYPNCKSGYTTYVALSNVQTFSSSGVPYGSNVDEYFLIDASGGGDLILNLASMDVENARNCVYDRIVIYNGGCTRFDVIDTHCGKRLRRWELTGTEYLVHFHSDGSIEKNGFTMQYYLGTASTGTPTTTTTTIGPPVASEVSLVGEVLTNYSVGNMPAKDLSSPLSSTVDVFFVGINDLDEVNQKLTSTMQFVIRWSDDFLSWPVAKKAGITQLLIPQDDIWKPDFALLNGFEKISQMGSSFMFVVVASNGSCTWKPYQILESVCPVDMSNYPYDTQTCELKFSTWSSSSKEVTTSLGSNGIAKHERFVEHGEWKLVSISQRNGTENGKAVTVFTITMKRNHAFTVFYIAVPVVMLSYLCVFTFALPLSSGEKSSFGITVFLSFVVYVIVTFQKMPENSESLPLFGIYVLFMVCVSGICVMIVTLESRMLTLSTKNKPIAHCTRIVTKRVILLQNKLLCSGSKTAVERLAKGSEKGDNVKKKDKIKEEYDESKAWPDFVSALDFICFWVYLFVVTAATLYFMVYLGVQ